MSPARGRTRPKWLDKPRPCKECYRSEKVLKPEDICPDCGCCLHCGCAVGCVNNPNGESSAQTRVRLKREEQR